MSDIYQYEPLWGSWFIESLIGEGSFGKVYKIRRERVGDGEVYNPPITKTEPVLIAVCVLAVIFLGVWLNNDFYNAAFTTAEQARIQEINVINSDNSTFGNSRLRAKGGRF